MTTKLAKAAAQKLKGVIIEYDALCSTLIGRTMAEQAAQQRRSDAQHLKEEREREAQGVGLFSKVSNMFVHDVRTMLKDLNADSTGKPWIVKERLQSTLQGLPAEVLDRVTGDSLNAAASGKSEEEQYLEKQLASANAEIERMRERRSAEKEELLQKRTQASGGSSAVRDKYLDKINKLKAKAKTRDPNEALAAFTGATAVVPEAAVEPAKGLTTWLVHDGANEVMSYATLRGLAKAITPPQASVQEEEFRLFCKEMEMQFDLFMDTQDYARLPDPAPIQKLCKDLDLTPAEVLVIARHPGTIRAARSAGAHTCHYRKSESEIPNHSADFQITTLRDFQFLVEDFNGISYRGRVIY